MYMPNIPDPRVEERVIEALTRLGVSGWHSRTDIARALDHDRLNVSELAALDRLAESGHIQRRIEKAKNPLINRYEYSLKGEA